MISKPNENPMIAISVRIYQVLLFVYPTKFQQEYGPQMLQVFRDCCLRAFRQNGTNGMLKLWAITFFDFLHSMVEEHLQKETFMTRSKFIQLSGWSLMLGGVILLVGFLVSSTVFDFLLSFWTTLVLLGVGLLGLRTRYGDEVGSFGKNILLLGVIAGFVINITGTAIVANVGNWSGPFIWLLPYTGHAVLLACLSIFGISALSAKPLPRWNGLPLIAGIWYPSLVILAYIYEAIGLSQEALGNPALIGILLQCVLLVVLGYMLQADMLQETPAIA